MVTYNILGADFDFEEIDNSIEQYFDVPEVVRPNDELSISELPHIGRIISERLYQTRPDIVIACDRGARLITLATKLAWQNRFPGERFPTIDSQIHFARVTNRSAPQDDVIQVIRKTLETAGLDEIEPGTLGPKITLLDDWTYYGDTAKLFASVAKHYGQVDLITAVGARNFTLGIDHFSAIPQRTPKYAEWDSAGFLGELLVGVSYGASGVGAIIPCSRRTPASVDARQRLIQETDTYFARFRSAQATSTI